MKLFPIRIGATVLAILCFTLPFVRVSCNNQPVQEVAGLELAIGKELPELEFAKSVQGDSLASDMSGLGIENKTTKNDDIDIRWETTIALGLLVLGFIIGLILRRKEGALLNGICAVLAVISLGALFINVPRQEENLFGISVSYKLLSWYWTAILLSAAAAVIGFLDFVSKRKKPLVLPTDPVQPLAPTAFIEGIDSPAEAESGSQEKTE